METKITPPKKRLNLILQSKGGVGKSTLMYVLALKYNRPNVVFIDLDNESKSSATHLDKFTNCSSFNLIDAKTKSIKRSMLDKFIGNFLSQDDFTDCFCDFGASSSEQFSNYLTDTGSLQILKELIDTNLIELNIFSVITGGISFNASAQYIKELALNLNGVGNFYLFQNQYEEYAPSQNKILREFEKTGMTPIEFSLVGNTNDSVVVDELKEIMATGENPLDKLSIISKMRIKAYLNELDLIPWLK